jgi:hypothetical protein
MHDIAVRAWQLGCSLGVHSIELQISAPVCNQMQTLHTFRKRGTRVFLPDWRRSHVQNMRDGEP